MDKHFDNYSWDNVSNKSLSEEKESAMRSKAMLIIARKNSSSKVWKRTIKRFISCVNNLGDKL